MLFELILLAYIISIFVNCLSRSLDSDFFDDDNGSFYSYFSVLRSGDLALLGISRSCRFLSIVQFAIRIWITLIIILLFLYYSLQCVSLCSLSPRLPHLYGDVSLVGASYLETEGTETNSSERKEETKRASKRKELLRGCCRF